MRRTKRMPPALGGAKTWLRGVDGVGGADLGAFSPYVTCAFTSDKNQAPVTASLGDGAVSDLVRSDVVKYGAAAALVYHGYKRTGSIVWALLYGLAGREVPLVAVPVALAQGFGEKKGCP